MEQLNLPIYEANIKKIGGMVKIFDTQRRKFVALTPEEWVRQNFVHYLMEHKGYSPAYVANEVALTLNGMTRRCDSVVYGKNMHPSMVLEFKATSVEINQRVFDQICRYNMVLQVRYLVISNGLVHYCMKLNENRDGYIFMEDIPLYDDLK